MMIIELILSSVFLQKYFIKMIANLCQKNVIEYIKETQILDPQKRQTPGAGPPRGHCPRPAARLTAPPDPQLHGFFET